jgi:hypothetical protein
MLVSSSDRIGALLVLFASILVAPLADTRSRTPSPCWS